MNEAIAYLNGEFLPVSKAALSVFDLGVVAGSSVSEMARTFRHVPFRLDEHLRRLEQSLDVVKVDPGLSSSEIQSICLQVVQNNAKLIPRDHDLGLIIFVTAGQNLTYLGMHERTRARTPSVCVHTFPLPFELWSGRYLTGLHLVTTSVKSLPDDVIDTRIKHRSRLHWHLADLEAKKVDPAAMALLTDHDGLLTETGTGNLCIVTGSTIATPSQHVLAGISRDVAGELATSLGLTFVTARIRPDELSRATEAFLTSTPHCMLPVTRFNGSPIGAGVPGPVFQRLMAAWSDLVGVDIVKQMHDGALSRTATP
ncbi:aminotransferase class IV [Schlesneria sp. T3-172]|uniref:aminotransferase class IV n=1 Tax=Schlesneria TaxID=656899 RepID=UPI002EE25190